ncbi:uncharacterized protein LOC131182836 [Hevea brasiliensis]|uniref:uncharacterized protein LOC131182836 n=1 Tax=Hevea brasiliensis TaxID=3981 RepID=UPI0025E84489|nr:uncharacterized protein LOC131182836 [Hevea brasiliensis]
MKTNLKIESLKGLSLSLLFVLMIVISGYSAAPLEDNIANSSCMCNATTAQRIQEDSDVDGNLFRYPSTGKQAFCNSAIYGNCIRPFGARNRPCTFYNRCKRK